MATNTLTAAALTVQLVLPAFSDFVQKAGLDIKVPLTEERITKSYVAKHSPAVMVIIDRQHQFDWRSREDKGKDRHLGWINYYDLSNSISRLEGDSRLMPLTKQKSLITTNEAREIAQGFFQRAGYDLRKVKAGAPTVKQWKYQPEGDPVGLTLPGYDIRYTPAGVKKPHWSETLAEVEVSGLTKKITRFTCSPSAAGAVAVDLNKVAQEQR